MAQMASGAAGAQAGSVNAREAFAGIFTAEQKAEIRDRIIADGGRALAELLAKEETDRPRIPYDDSGHLIPADMAQTFVIAQWLVSLKLYCVREKGGGQRFYTVPEIALIVAAGRRLRLDPLAAMETIALINNRTAIWGRGIRGIVMASGQVEDWKIEYQDITDGVCGEDGRVVVTIKRKGIPTPFVGSFGVAQAEQAGLWVDEETLKSSPGLRHSSWWKYPIDMLTWRAVGRAALGFADILAGMRVAEDLDDDDAPSGRRERGNRQPREGEGGSIETLARALAEMPDPAPAPAAAGGAGEGATVPEPAPAPVPVSAPFVETSKGVAEVAASLEATVGRRRPKRGSSLSAAEMLSGNVGTFKGADIDAAFGSTSPNRPEGGGK